jgi:hypothetical protein
MTFAEADKIVSTGESTVVSADRPVWVVTVHAPMTTDAPADMTPKTWPYYTVVEDGYSGFPIVTAIGVNTLS